MNKKDFNKKGISPVTIIFWSIVFVIIYSMSLAPIITSQAEVAIINGGYTGIEALFYHNINLVIVFLFFVFVSAIGSAVSN